MWLRILALAGAYYLAGRLGLLLAVPPGYATAFEPATGVGLAGLLVFGVRAWPGVLLAAFLLHVPTGFESSSIVQSLGVPFTIAVGAALQAVVGAALVQRCVGYPNPVNREQDIGALLLVGGPLSCLIGATTGVSCLWLTGRIQTGEIGLNWCTWWVGASIGAFLVAPAVMVWTARPQRDWRRPITVSAPLLVLAGLVVALFLYTDKREQDYIDNSFKFQTESLTRAVQTRIDHALESLHSMRNFHSTSPTSTEHQRFSKAAKSILERRAAVQAFSWIPRVKEAARAEFENACRQTIDADFRIRERKPGGELEDAANRPVHYPVIYREPPPSHARSLGFDVASERLDVLELAAQKGLPIASPPIAQAQNKLGDKTVVVYLAIYRDDLVPDSGAERPEAVLGYIAAVLQVGKIVQLAWEGFDSEGIDFWIFDESASKSTNLAYFRGTPRGMSEMVSIADEPSKAAAAMERETTIEVAGRNWTLRFVQTPVYLAAQRSMQAWTVLAGGMILTGLLGAVLLVVTGRAELVAGLVEKRTAELAQANTAVRQEIGERKRLEQEVVDVAVAEQRRIGQELHDGTGQELTGLCMLADNLADALRESSPQDAQLARRIAQGLRQALGQVRALSRGLIPVEVDAEGLMAALTELTSRISELHGLNCVFECAEPVPVEDNYTATQLYRIAQEAITNAIKHGQPHTIRVTLEARGHYLTLRIVDDGIGFSPAETNGDGMGLQIMRYRAGQIGAKFVVRPGPTRGAIVSCTLLRGNFHA
jgi:signal transduction histidine kinase